MTDQPAAQVAAPVTPLNVNIGDWLKAAWELFKTDIVTLVVANLIATVLAAVTCGVLAGPMMVGLYHTFQKKARGQKFEYGDLFWGLSNQFLPSFLIILVFFVALSLVGVIPCVGPLLSSLAMLALSPLLLYSLCLLADAPQTVPVGGLQDLVKGVWTKLQPQYLMFVVWILVAYIISGAGSIACGIGMLVTAPIGVMGLMVSYLDVFKGEKPVIAKQ